MVYCRNLGGSEIMRPGFSVPVRVRDTSDVLPQPCGIHDVPCKKKTLISAVTRGDERSIRWSFNLWRKRHHRVSRLAPTTSPCEQQLSAKRLRYPSGSNICVSTMKFLSGVLVLATLEAVAATTMTGAPPLANLVQAQGTWG